MIKLLLIASTFAATMTLTAQTAPKTAANSLQPYSADETTEQIRMKPGGQRTTVVSTAHVYRDSKGRRRREVTYADLTGGNVKRTAVTVTDVVAGFRYELDAATKTAYRDTVPDPGPARGGGGERREGGGGGGEGERREGGGGGEGERREGGEGRGAGSSRKHEDLGIQTINGLNAHGSRNTVTVAGGSIIDERWVSVDLGVDLKSIHSDATTGQTVLTVTNIKRAEPAAYLFQVPPGYAVKQRAQ